jgi:hypothetical protein
MVDQLDERSNVEAAGHATPAEANSNPTTSATEPPPIGADESVPRGLAGWSIVVGFVIAAGGAAMVVFFAQVPQALAL